MSHTTVFQEWFISSLFVLCILLIPIGLSFFFIPRKMFLIANKVNKWISTDNFFHSINKPIYKERFFYRNHRIVGTLVIVISVLCLYFLTFYVGVETVTDNILRLSDSNFSKWLNVILYYILLFLISLVIIFGFILVIRPSLLKTFEKWCNHWVDTESSLNLLNSRNDLPDKYLPGNPRLFGLLILFSAVYIVWCTYPF